MNKTETLCTNCRKKTVNGTKCGPKPRLSKTMLTRLCKLIRSGIPRKYAAELCGFSYSSLRKWEKRGLKAAEEDQAGRKVPPTERVFFDFLKALKKAEAERETPLCLGLSLAAQAGSLRAVMVLLEVRVPEEFGRPGSRRRLTNKKMSIDFTR